MPVRLQVAGVCLVESLPDRANEVNETRGPREHEQTVESTRVHERKAHWRGYPKGRVLDQRYSVY